MTWPAQAHCHFNYRSFVCLVCTGDTSSIFNTTTNLVIDSDFNNNSTVDDDDDDDETQQSKSKPDIVTTTNNAIDDNCHGNHGNHGNHDGITTMTIVKNNSIRRTPIVKSQRKKTKAKTNKPRIVGTKLLERATRIRNKNDKLSRRTAKSSGRNKVVQSNPNTPTKLIAGTKTRGNSGGSVAGHTPNNKNKSNKRRPLNTKMANQMATTAKKKRYGTKLFKKKVANDVDTTGADGHTENDENRVDADSDADDNVNVDQGEQTIVNDNITDLSGERVSVSDRFSSFGLISSHSVY